jgi:dTDP-4-dehydrorhamnose 3,5-epimerase
MDEIDIEDLILTPLKQIHHPKGDILHALKKSDPEYSGFGEAYFSTIKNGEIKGWNKHKTMILNLIVPFGEVTFIIYDKREGSRSKERFFKVTLSQVNYQRLTVPPRVWIAFRGNGINTNLILNIANMEHDPNEIEKMNLGKIPYNFDSD